MYRELVHVTHVLVDETIRTINHFRAGPMAKGELLIGGLSNETSKDVSRVEDVGARLEMDPEEGDGD